mgnify:CR=1 FL=1
MRYGLTKDAKHGYSVNATKGEVRLATSKDATRDTKRSRMRLKTQPTATKNNLKNRVNTSKKGAM